MGRGTEEWEGQGRERGGKEREEEKRSDGEKEKEIKVEKKEIGGREGRKTSERREGTLLHSKNFSRLKAFLNGSPVTKYINYTSIH